MAGHRLFVETTWDGRPARADERVRFDLRFTAEGLRVDIDAPFHGDPPPSAPPGPTWALWAHEAVEVFVLGRGGRYTELEFGPFGHHLALDLVGRRRIVRRDRPVRLSVRRGPRWRARAFVPGLAAGRVFAAAVHGPADARRYLVSWSAPGPRPDFHALEDYRVSAPRCGAAS